MESNDSNDNGKDKKKINEEDNNINENSIEVVKISSFRNCDILNNTFKKK